MRNAWLLCCAVGLVSTAHADPISFADALARASADAPTVAARKAAVEAARHSIVPAGQLPDPQVALGLDAFPVSGPDRYSLTKDNFTMLSVGVSQDVPNTAKRRARTQLATADASAAAATLEATRLEARLGAATAWINLYYAGAKQRSLDALAIDLRELADASTSGLAAGKSSADAALSARMEVERVADRRADAKAHSLAARAELEHWIGPIGEEPPSSDAPSFAIDPDLLRNHLEHHIALAVSVAEIERAQAGLELARADRNPDWGWQMTYQRRDPAFGDFVSAGVHFSLPLFQSTRQSPTIDARRADVVRAGAEREAMLRDHRATLEARLAEFASLGERLARARDVMLPLAHQREAVAAAAYQAGTLPLMNLIAARRDATEAELERIDLEHKRTQVGAFLSLEYGETGQ